MAVTAHEPTSASSADATCDALSPNPAWCVVTAKLALHSASHSVKPGDSIAWRVERAG